MRAGIRLIRLYKAVILREGAGPQEGRARARYQASLVLGARYRPGASFCPRSCACAQDDSIICRDDNRLGGYSVPLRCDLRMLIEHPTSSGHPAPSSYLSLLSNCHPCEGEDLRKVERGGDIGLRRFMEPYIGRSLHSARGPRLRKDDSIIYRFYNRLGGFISPSHRDFAMLLHHAASSGHPAHSSYLPLLSSCHPCEGEDLRKVERGGDISLPRFLERYIGRSFRSARGPRLRKDDSIICRFYNRLGGGSTSSGWRAVRALRRFASRGHAAAQSFLLAHSSYLPLLSSCHPCEGEDLRTVERGGSINLPRFMEPYIGRSLRSARGPRLRKDDSFDICGNRLGGRVTTARGLRRASR